MTWPQWVCPCSQHACFPCLHCLVCRLLCWEPSEACPGFYALPRSKLLRFRYSGSPQKPRLSWACVLGPSQAGPSSSGDQVFGKHSRCHLSPPPFLPLGFLSAQPSQADVNHPESQEVLVSNETCLQFGRLCLSGAAIALFWLWLPSPVTEEGWAGLKLASSSQSFVL